MLLLALNSLDKATIALVAVTGFLALVALFQLISTNRSEARRSQPVAIAHRVGPRDEFTRFKVFLTNEGAGTAFNVRFGVRLDGTEYAVGGERGHRYTIGQGKRVPEEPAEHLSVEVSYAPYALAKGGRDVDSRAVFWARYENAFGRMYETANPVDPFADFEVFRSRGWKRRWREWRQNSKRQRDEQVANRRVAEELKANLDVSKLPRRRRFERKFLRR
jgi:hypothetical protein